MPKPLDQETLLSNPMSYLTYCRTQQVDWTWQRANQLWLAKTQPRASLDDAWILLTWHYLTEGKAIGPPGRPPPPPEKLHAIAAARAVYEAGGLERSVLEARLLSGQSYQEIATRSALTPAAVRTYEHIFFYFRPFRQSIHWIMQHAVGRQPSGGPPLIGVTLRRCGYQGGPQALEPMIDMVRKTDGKSLIEQLPDSSTPEGLRELAIRRQLALERVPHSSQSGPSLMLLHINVRATETLPEIPQVKQFSLDELLQRVIQ